MKSQSYIEQTDQPFIAYGNRIGNTNEYWVGAYIVKQVPNWKDPRTEERFNAILFRYLTSETPAGEVERIFKQRRFVLIHHKPENYCSHIVADPTWYKVFLSPPKEIVWLLGEDNHGKREDGEAGCSTYTPLQLSEAKKYYRSVYKINSSSKLSTILNYLCCCISRRRG